MTSLSRNLSARPSLMIPCESWRRRCSENSSLSASVSRRGVDVVATALPGALIYTVQKGANTVPDFSALSAALTTLFGRFAPKNARLRNKITQALKTYPELEAVVYDVALKQPANPTPEQVHANLQERAQAIIARHPELEVDLRG